MKIPSFFRSSTSRNIDDDVTMHVHRDWGIILITLILLVAAAAGYGTYLFIQVERGTLYEINIADQPQVHTFDTVLLESTLEKFREKKRQYEGHLESQLDVPHVSAVIRSVDDDI